MFRELCIGSKPLMVDYQDFQYGPKLHYLEDFLKHTNGVKLALLTDGADLEPYAAFRKCLHQLSANFEWGEVVDLGGFKGGEIGLRELVSALTKKNILPIIVSSNAALPLSLLKSFDRSPEAQHLSVVDSHIPYAVEGPEALVQALLHTDTVSLKRLYWLAYQSYFVHPEALTLLSNRQFEAQRLGKIRNGISELEPTMRDSNLLAFNLAALTYADAPCQLQPNPNGLSAVDACRLMRYAAMSDRMKAIGIYGFYEDKTELSAMLLAQMIWYIVEGFKQRQQEFPVHVPDLLRYEVQLNSGDLPVSFFKSQRTERWWFFIHQDAAPYTADEIHQDLLEPCSYQDYLKTCEGDIPDRLLNALSRTS